MRVQVLEKIIFLFLGLIVAALVYMQLVRGDYYRGLSVNNRIRVLPIDAPRGRILDRNGTVLADNRPSFNIAVIPQDVEDADALFAFLGRVLKKDPQALQRTFTRRRVTPFEPVIIGEDVDRKDMITAQENRFQYPGLVTQESFQRLYPLREAAAHLVGYVGRVDPAEAQMLQEYGYTPLSLVGKNGAERFYENVVEGVPGGRQIEVNSRGQEVRLLGLKDPVKGKDIALTIDARIQSAAMQLFDGRPGAAVVLDLSDGDVLALVSSPSFDPNVFTDRSRHDGIEAYIRSPASPLLDRAIAGQYPPGSVFKIPVALAAIERHKVTTDTTVDCPGYYMLGSARFGCAHVHGHVDFTQAIARSCNVFFYRTGQMVTAPIIGAYARAFGLGRPAGIDLPFEARGQLVLPGQKQYGWHTGDTLNLSIGQGDTLATPLQLAVLAAAVANDGIILRPRVLKILNGKTQPQPDLSKRPIVRLRDATWRAVQNGMRMAIEDEEGTAHVLAGLKGMTVWGKTGTAQAGSKGNHAWFVGYARSARGNWAFCVFLEHGGASANAVMLARDLLERMQAQGAI